LSPTTSQTRNHSFNNLSRWLKLIDTYGSDVANRVLVGCKNDRDSRKVVDTATAKEYAESHGLPFYETSAKTGQNVDGVFLHLAKDIKARSVLALAIGG
jgi:GTPase SAR1 family protein